MRMELFNPERTPFLTTVILHSRLTWSIRLRWLAVFSFFIASWLSKAFFEIPVNYEEMWITLSILAGINIIHFITLRLFKEISLMTEIILLSIHIIIDLIFLTQLVHLTGGIENPIYLFYVFHVVLSSILFPRWLPLVFATIVAVLFSGLVFAEAFGIIHHHNVFSQDLHSNAILVSLVVIVFVITVYVTAYICMTFMTIYRESKRIIDTQNQKLIEADKQKSQFFQFASHELKSPIVALKSTIDALLKSYYDKMDNKVLDSLKRASNRAGQMLEIIKELLELSKSPDSYRTEGVEELHINTLIREIIASELPSAQHKNIKFIDELSSETEEVKVKYKKTDLIRVFNNIISNAINYTRSQGSVKVKTRVESNYYEFVVEDTGIGIKEEDLPKVFSEFYRGENAKKAVSYGTGLGLSLVKNIVDNYGGKISVDSELDKGTTVKILLPLT
ncbi:MAG: HAMP domain-containing histidine kinase [Calditrichaceae bacterium]|nr:HAMP domain-containing histidine kinase [Calditrichaceae bacterium]MBN2709903.1 HAMP domain-containing histidine kinase [Calditrichaceae bacterium]RQV92658.1 MAG: sensor histidine kinase [Calditrichota bacterium]